MKSDGNFFHLELHPLHPSHLPIIRTSEAHQRNGTPLTSGASHETEDESFFGSRDFVGGLEHLLRFQHLFFRQGQPLFGFGCGGSFLLSLKRKGNQEKRLIKALGQK